MSPDACCDFFSDCHQLVEGFAGAEGFAPAQQSEAETLQLVAGNSALVAVSFPLTVDGERCYAYGLRHGACVVAEVLHFAFGAWPAVVDVVLHDFF